MSIHNRLELRRKVAKLFIIRCSGYTFDSQRKYPHWELPNKEIKSLLELGVGGVIFYGGSTCELHNRTRTFLHWADSPLLFCADAEEGMGQRFDGATHLMPPMSLGKLYESNPIKAIYLAELYGKCTAQEARKCGLNWILAPVCDVNTNPLNPVINLRSWGEDPNTTKELTCAFHRGLASLKVLSCAKHFPGHGDTGEDSHLQMPVVRHGINRLEEIELLPFRSLIDEGVSSIMVGHLLMQSIDSVLPATLSSLVISNLLREKLGFQGIIVTDALIMNSISAKYGCSEAAVLAFEAGVDLLLMPERPLKAIDAIYNAIISGRIGIDRLEESLLRRKEMLRLTELNSDYDLQKKNLYECQELIEDDNKILFHELLEDSIIMRKPLYESSSRSGINLISIDNRDLLSNTGRIEDSPAVQIPTKQGYKPIIIDQMSLNILDREDNLCLDCLPEGRILLQIFFRGKPFLRDLISDRSWRNIIIKLNKSNRLDGVIIYGSHYFWDNLEPCFGNSIASAYSMGQIPEAQIAILNNFFQVDNCSEISTNEFTD